MKSKKNLVLLGMMGSGKSTIGGLVAKTLNKNFRDVDKIIEKKLNMKIFEIFKNMGEAEFRKLEEKITLKCLNCSESIISLGGGGFLNNKIRKEVISNSLSFWLNSDYFTIISRIKNNKKRPVAYKLNEKELIELMKKRSKVYSKANFKINCHKLTKNEIVSKIITIYEKKTNNSKN